MSRAHTCVTSIVEDNGRARARAIVIAVVVGVGCTDVDYTVGGRAEQSMGRERGREGNETRERERGSEERGGSLRMAGVTVYEGAARAPTPPGGW